MQPVFCIFLQNIFSFMYFFTKRNFSRAGQKSSAYTYSGEIYGKIPEKKYSLEVHIMLTLPLVIVLAQTLVVFSI